MISGNTVRANDYEPAYYEHSFIMNQAEGLNKYTPIAFILNVILRYLQPFSLQVRPKRANIRVRTCAYLLLQDGPNRIIHRIQVRTGRWPLLFGNEVNFLFSEPLLGGVSCVSWSSILLEGPTRISKILTTETFHFSIQNDFTVGFRIDFYPKSGQK